MKYLSIGHVAIAAAAVLAVACGRPEQLVVEKYFQAVNAKDNGTLGSFALVGLDKKVDDWKFVGPAAEAQEAAPLTALLAKQKEIEGQITQNKKEYNAYFLDHMSEVDQVRAAKKAGDKIPPKLTGVAADWERFTEKEKDLKRVLADAKLAVEREKKTMMLSIGNVDDIEAMEGLVLTKQLDMELTIGGQAQPYKMTLKRYDVKPPTGPKVGSRWIIANLVKS
jgi:hypothetical protein